MPFPAPPRSRQPFPSGCGTFVDLLDWRARTQPDRAAYTFLSFGDEGPSTLDYRELAARARRVAAALHAVVGPGERALLLFPPGLDFVCAFLGCLAAGVVAVPAYPPRGGRQLELLGLLAADCAPAVALTTAGGLEAAWAPYLTGRGVRLLSTDGLSEDRPAGDLPAPRPGDLAFLQYTSGSSGHPKGVMVTHGNLMADSLMVYEGMGHGPDSVMVSWLPPYHDMGLIGGILQPLFGGFPSYLMSPLAFLKRPIRWLDAISRYRATCSGGPNFAFDLVAGRVTADQIAGLDLSCWKVAVNGAEPVRTQTLEKFAATFAPCGFRPEAFYPCYGLAEATLIVTGGAPTSHVRTDAPHLPPLAGCGRVLGEQSVIVVDPATGLPTSAGVVGEIWVAGPNVARGYWRKPEQTAEVFGGRLAGGEEGPFLRTGDLGYVEDGVLVPAGRMKEIILAAGRNLYPHDVEATCEACHPALRAAGGAAFGIERDGTEALVVVHEVEVSAHPDARPEVAIPAILRAVHDTHGIAPAAIVLIRSGALPRTTSGKIRRRACRDAYLEGSLPAIATWPAARSADATAHSLAPVEPT